MPDASPELISSADPFEQVPESAPRTAPKNRVPLGQRLVNAGLLTPSQLDLSLREQKRRGEFLGEVLIQLGFVSADNITKALAEENEVDVVDLQNCSLKPDLLALLPYEMAKSQRAIPLDLKGNILTVVFADSFDVVAQDTIERQVGRSIHVVTASEGQVLEAIERNYAQSQSINETVEQILTGHSSDLADEQDAPMVKLVDQIIAAGIHGEATDIHLHPEEKNLKIRMRVDGILRQEVVVPRAIQAPIIARIKLIAGMDITEKRTPQDGRLRFRFGNSNLDLRISTLPTNHGESIVMRVLDTGGLKTSLEELGLSSNDQRRFEQAIANPYGMVLVTGPTGSGKTTSLYTALGQIDRETRSVFTLEDPIEYTLSSIRQTQVNADIGMSFATGLRALLRQDPDVILVGEIRDTETAELATRAALTGHLVFSTLHTNNAVGVIPRLIDMGVDQYLLPSALVGIIGQRLLRKLCTHCRCEVAGPDPLLESTDIEGCESASNTNHWQAAGCEQCRHSGYSGRLAVYEVLLVDHSFHSAILSNAGEAELLKIALAGGMTTMLQDGLSKASLGLTNVKEVLRVLR